MGYEVERDANGNVIGLEIEFFDEDPDGEDDRAGDGYYYRWDGDGSWSGAWHSEEEAEREAIDELTWNLERNAVFAIHRRTGWPIACLWKDSAEGSPSDGARPIHLFCIAPDGDAFDLDGHLQLDSIPKAFCEDEGEMPLYRIQRHGTEAEWARLAQELPAAHHLWPHVVEVDRAEKVIARSPSFLAQIEEASAETAPSP